MTKKVLIPLVAATLIGLVGCNHSDTPSSSEYVADLSEKVTLKMSVHYQDDKTEVAFGKTDGYTNYKDPAGNTYKTGDLKPAWKALTERLNFEIEDVHNGNKVDASYANLKGDTNGAFSGVDILCGKASSFANDGVSGDYFVNLLDYMDKLPNFKKFLQNNPIVKLTITSNAYTTDGSAKSAIYYAPYFDGFDDIERMSLLRADWVKKLLDENSTFDTETVVTTKYAPTYGDAARDVKVAASLDGKSTKTIKKAAVKNVITRMNELSTKNGQTLVACLKAYLQEAYGNQYTKLSDFYCGFDAAYDADEYIALLRCVKANPQLLSGTNNVVPFYTRAYTNDRVSDLYRFAGQLFGVRGLESRSNYLFADKDGKVKDARGELATANVLAKLHTMYEEGLILTDFDKQGSSAKGNWNDDYLAKGTAFASYDYAQTQAAYNDKVDRTKAALKDFDFRPVMGAVADLDDGVANNFVHFTESWRSVKSEGWGISKAAASNPAVLDRALAVVDYFYSTAGNMLMSYGPEEYGYIAKDSDGNIKYIDYNGKKVPQLSDAMLAQLADKKIGNANYTNYFRYFVGSTYPVGYVKEQGMEYQCTTANGKSGLNNISANIIANTLVHPSVDNFTKSGNNPFFSLMPTTFRLTASEASTLDTYTNLKKITSEKITGGTNYWDDYVIYGYGYSDASKTLKATPEALIQEMKDWHIDEFSKAYNDAYKLMVDSY